MARAFPRSAAALVLTGLALVPAGCGGDPPPAAPPARAVRYGADGRPAAPDVVATRRLDVIWVCLDTVRADAFAPWAKGDVAMPATSAWLERHAVAFTQASSTAPWTGPAVASLFTSLLPSAHGARELSDRMSLVPAVTTAAEILAAQGWFTVAYTGGGWVGKGNGMLQGFREPLTPFSFAGEAEHVLQVFAGSRAYRPRFLFFHTYEAHDPYLAPPARLHAPPTPPPEVDLAAIDREAAADGGRSLVRRFLLDAATREVVFGTAFGGPRKAAVTRWLERGYRDDPEGPALAAEAKAAYVAGLRRLDTALAGWLAALDDLRLLDDAVLVVTSDHGEGFGEHGTMHHGRRLYDELVHVPLYVRAPGFPPGRRIAAPCSLLDVLPTTLELVGLPPLAGAEGASLVPLLAGAPGRPVPSEELRTGTETGGDDHALLVAVRDATHKWIRTTDLRTGTSAEEAYDLVADPGETRPLPPGTRFPPAFEEVVRAQRRPR
ncbi:MAG: sulfatase-like hydrolase/transferase [Planctomycetia bacterium]|nr:sulfatase-like hydrolase/transferase [Planctomycetia bacterium]